MANIPGITISILRSQTFGQTGQPLQISGRVTAFSVPLPLSFVRVSLTGPDYDPQTTAFDTLADPEGNYAVGVVAPADGNYTVKADAYPFPLLPQGPLIAQPILLPSIGESDSPPLVFGAPGPGGVIASGPNGAANLGAPALTQPELNLNLAIDDVPQELRDRAISVLIATGHPCDRVWVANTLFTRLNIRYDESVTQGFAAVRPHWERYSGLSGKRVAVVDAGTREEGIVKGIDTDGALLLETSSGVRRIIAGDVTLEGAYQ